MSLLLQEQPFVEASFSLSPPVGRGRSSLLLQEQPFVEAVAKNGRMVTG